MDGPRNNPCHNQTLEKASSPPPKANQAASSSENLSGSGQQQAQVQDFSDAIVVTPYGIMGFMQMRKGFNSLARVGDLPNSSMVLVDPAGMRFIRHGIHHGTGCSGLAKDLYMHLEIDEHHRGRLPPSVASEITAQSMASYFEYDTSKGTRKVIHVVGPDMRCLGYGVALKILKKSYYNVFQKFVALEETHLRLPVLSGGIFLGSYGNDIHDMTAAAIDGAIRSLEQDEITKLLSCTIELCTFVSGEAERFHRACVHHGIAKAHEQRGDPRQPAKPPPQ